MGKSRHKEPKKLQQKFKPYRGDQYLERPTFIPLKNACNPLFKYLHSGGGGSPFYSHGLAKFGKPYHNLVQYKRHAPYTVFRNTKLHTLAS